MGNNRELLPQYIVSQVLESLAIKQTHNSQCLEEAAYYFQHTDQHSGQNNGLDDPELLDLTQLPFVTIDHDTSGSISNDNTNDNSRDTACDLIHEFSGDQSQALYIERDSQGYKVMYALADVSYYIKPASALFNEALQRGTTLRTPVLTVPILPAQLLTDLILLSPHVPRRSLVFDIRLDNNASVHSCKILRAKICSAAKLSYSGVQRWLDSNATDTQSYHSSLKLFKVVGAKLFEAEIEKGAVYFDTTEVQLTAAGSPPRFVSATRERFDTEQYCEQISQVCDRQGATILMGLEGVSDVQKAMFRVHELPLKKSLIALKAALNEWANSDSQSELWQWHDGQSLAQFIEALPKEKLHCRRVHAIHRQIMQAQKSSTYTSEPDDHYALKTSSYARFSSPVHDVFGIFAQRELLEALCGARYDDDANHATRHTLREDVINATNGARLQQRVLDKNIAFAALHSYFKQDLENNDAPWRVGTIIGIGTDKLYVSLDDMPLDIKVYRSDLEALYATQYTSTQTHVIASNQDVQSWQLGQGVHLKLQRYDSTNERFVFCMQPDTQTQ